MMHSTIMRLGAFKVGFVIYFGVNNEGLLIFSGQTIV